MAEPNQPLEQQVQAGQESSNTKKVHDNGNANQINPTEVPRPIVSSDEPFTCQWTNCNVQAGSPDALYEHICEKHIGRKSTNNLNLSCGWKGCSVTVVKRDHITSHIRVHVPLKPHKCDFCGKSFKRPQDLKKHVKTHADDSMHLRAGDPGQNGGYRQGGKLISDLHSFAGNPGYSQIHQTPAAPYGYTQSSVHSSYYTPQQSQNTYTPVFYPINNANHMAQQPTYESKKRSFDVLNDLFGDAKRRQIDPTSYTQVGQRLTALANIPMHGGGLIDYMQPVPALVSVNGHGGHHAGSMPQPQYTLPPMPNLRTKTDLLNIDQFLEQMQSTVYENPNAAAAAGVQQPGAHYTHQALNFRQSHSPPQTALNTSAHYSAAPSVSTSYSAAPITSSHSAQSSIATPDLTPGSSAMSYHSSDSPISMNDMSPLSQHSATVASYPSLPPVTMSYSPHSTNTPASTLGTNFDSDQRRRYSGGMLQKAAQHRNPDASDSSSDGSAPPTPKLGEKGSIDPALSAMRSPSLPSESGDSAKDRAEEAWIENIRVIEALRNFVKERLERNEFESEGRDEDTEMGGMKGAETRGESEPDVASNSVGLYPTIRVDDE